MPIESKSDIFPQEHDKYVSFEIARKKLSYNKSNTENG